MSLAAYEQHGLSVVRSRKNQVVADCPFCGKDAHFHVSRETGLWDCKSCQQKGNLYTFLKLLYDEGVAASKPKNALNTLAEHRGVPSASLRQAGVCVHPLLSETYLLPHFNEEGKLSNLYLYTPSQKKGLPTVRSTADCTPHPFRPDPSRSAPSPGDSVFLAEGHWDAIVASLALGDAWVVWGVPGSGFRDQWASLLEGTEVYVATDNDPINPKTGLRPGEQLQLRIREALTPVVKSLSVLRWEADKDPNDVRDVYLEYAYGKPHPAEKRPPYRADMQIRTPRDAASALSKFLLVRRETVHAPRPSSQEDVPVSDFREKVQSTECRSLDELLHEFKKNYSLTSRLHSAIALTYAVHLSLLIPGKMIWLYLVGGASTGKSTAVALLEDHQDRNLPVDNFTGLSSGWRTRGKGPSMPQRMNGRTVTFKDWTAILSIGPTEQERIMGELRGIFDGYQNVYYRNQVVSQSAGLNFNIVAATTPRVHANNRAELGERFLKFVMDQGETRSTRRRRSNAAVQKFISQLSQTAQGGTPILPMPLRKASKGFCEHLYSTWDPSRAPEFSQEYIDKVIDLAELVAITRVRVDRQGQDLLYRPVAEGESRLSEQLMKLTTALCHVTDRSPEENYPILRDLAFNTGWGFPLEIAQTIHKTGEALSKAQLAATLELPETTVWRHLQDMLEVKSVYREKLKNTSGRGGSGVHYFHLSSDLQGILDRVTS